MIEKLSQEQIKENLTFLRSFMSDHKINIYIVRATDQYLNEYIPLEENDRYHLSGFSGSTGDMIVTIERAFLFVDGRYYIQAEKECSPSLIEIVKVPFGKSNESILRLKLTSFDKQEKNRVFNIAFDGKKVSVKNFPLLRKALPDNFQFLDLEIQNLPHKLTNSKVTSNSKLEQLPLSVTGKSSYGKIKLIQNWLAEKKSDYLYISKLDDLSYLFNLRSYEIPYNSTIKGLALVWLSKAFVFMDLEHIPDWLEKDYGKFTQFYLVNDYEQVISELFKPTKKSSLKIVYDDAATTYHRLNQFKSYTEKANLCHFESPVTQMKTIKNASELEAMRQSFRKADGVIKSSIDWLNDNISTGISITEKVFSNKVKEFFFANNARGLSFEVITAGNKNGAIVHYTTPDSHTDLKAGDLMLLDTGGYFEEGYATDLTRTFLIGGNKVEASPKQKKIYTVVLKAAIRIMKARFPKGTLGVHLDTVARSALWEYGYVYNHGTGHGIGICVHETPPNLNSVSQVILKENMVFSVEPGIYIDGFGGVRIENIVTLKTDPELKDWLKVTPLTYCPLDKNLIDDNYLDDTELKWLDEYHKLSAELI